MSATGGKSTRHDIRTTVALLRLGQATPSAYRAGVALSLIDAVARALLPLWLKLIVDAVVRRDLAPALGLCVALAATGGAQLLANWRSFLALTDLQDRIDYDVDQRTIRAMALIDDLASVESRQLQDLVRTIDEERRWLAQAPRLVGQLVGFLARAFLTVVLLARVSLVLVILPLFAVPSVWAARRSVRAQTAATDLAASDHRVADLLFDMLTSARSAGEIRLHGGTERIARAQRSARGRAHARMASANLRSFGYIAGAALFASTAHGYALYVVADALRHGSATVGDVVLVVGLAAQVAGQLEHGLLLFTGWYKAHEALVRLRSLEELAALTSRGGPVMLRPVPAAIERGIRVEHVDFQYAGSDSPAVSGVDLFLPAGATIAIVGQNGAGKSTLVKMLAGLYTPTSGRILVDDLDLASLAGEWQQRVTGVFQDYSQFEFTVQHCIRLGDLLAEHPSAVVTRAAHMAGASAMIAGLPQGMNTQLGRSFDDGVDLSAGQWQKLALARGVMRTTALLQVLDEPVANLDPESEWHVFERHRRIALSHLARGGITVIVSHRFTTARNADLIVVMHHGRIVDTGTHQQLIGRAGIYRTMYDLQVSRFFQYVGADDTK